MSTLKEIFAAGPTAYLTAQEGEQFAQQKLINVDTSKTDPNNAKAYLVTLTESGKAAIAAEASATPPVAPTAPTAPATPPVAETAPVKTEGSPVDTGIGYDASQTDNIGPIVDTVAPPQPKAKKKSSGSGSTRTKYPFDHLPEPRAGEDGELVYASFAVVLEEGQTIEQLSKKVSSSVSAANSRAKEVVVGEDGQPVMEQFEGREYLRNEDGTYQKDEDGKRMSKVVTKTREKTTQTKRFRSFVMQEGDPAGQGVRVFRYPVEG